MEERSDDLDDSLEQDDHVFDGCFDGGDDVVVEPLCDRTEVALDGVDRSCDGVGDGVPHPAEELSDGVDDGLEFFELRPQPFDAFTDEMLDDFESVLEVSEHAHRCVGDVLVVEAEGE